jgi:hypothetical protein
VGRVAAVCPAPCSLAPRDEAGDFASGLNAGHPRDSSGARRAVVRMGDGQHGRLGMVRAAYGQCEAAEQLLVRSLVRHTPSLRRGRDIRGEEHKYRFLSRGMDRP